MSTTRSRRQFRLFPVIRAGSESVIQSVRANSAQSRESDTSRVARVRCRQCAPTIEIWAQLIQGLVDAGKSASGRCRGGRRVGGCRRGRHGWISHVVSL